MVYMYYIPYIDCLGMPFLPAILAVCNRVWNNTQRHLRTAAFTAISGITISLEEIHLKKTHVFWDSSAANISGT